jgi:catechol 2,3-dioxygenase-like lactoylglutathione lyase family enzyme
VSRAKPLGLGPIQQVGMHVADLDLAKQFYGEILGLNLVFEVPGMAFFQCGNLRLMLSLTQQDQPECRASILYFQTDSIDQACKALKDDFVPIVSEPHCVHRDEQHEVWMCFFHDPFENILALTEERPTGWGD